jgi:hypothetical protein
LWFSSVPSSKCQDSTSKLDHDCFLPYLFKLVHLIQCFVVQVCEKALLNKLQKTQHWQKFKLEYIFFRCLQLILAANILHGSIIWHDLYMRNISNHVFTWQY